MRAAAFTLLPLELAACGGGEGGEPRGLLDGIPQDGVVLGEPDTPVTLVGSADLQCPYCARFARTAFPAVAREHVRSGEVWLVFRGVVFLGPESEEALRAVLAAGQPAARARADAAAFRSVLDGLLGSTVAEAA